MTKSLLSSAMDIGEQMLCSGAEIYRVEDSMNRILNAYGFKRVDVFIITSSMVISVYDLNDEVYTQTRRIKGTSINLDKLDKLNSLSRMICLNKPEPEKINEELSKINASLHYPVWLNVLATAFIAMAFTLFFGGGFSEASISFVIGVITKIVSYFTDKVKTNILFERFIHSFLICFLAFITVKLSFVTTPDKIIIGNIMYLIPGVGFTNALRDMFKGDIFAGVHRTIESLLLAFSIAAGYIVTVLVFGGSL